MLQAAVTDVQGVKTSNEQDSVQSRAVQGVVSNDSKAALEGSSGIRWGAPTLPGVVRYLPSHCVQLCHSLASMLNCITTLVLVPQL